MYFSLSLERAVTAFHSHVFQLLGSITKMRRYELKDSTCVLKDLVGEGRRLSTEDLNFQLTSAARKFYFDLIYGTDCGKNFNVNSYITIRLPFPFLCLPRLLKHNLSKNSLVQQDPANFLFFFQTLWHHFLEYSFTNHLTSHYSFEEGSCKLLYKLQFLLSKYCFREAIIFIRGQISYPSPQINFCSS